MATTRFSASTLTDGGAFPVSLRDLLRASIQGKGAHRRSQGRVVGGVVVDGGSFPQRLSRSLNPRRPHYRAAPPRGISRTRCAAANQALEKA